MTLDIHVPAGSTGHGPLTVDIGADDAGWTYCGLRVAVLGIRVPWLPVASQPWRALRRGFFLLMT